jgi:hypothetical protein
MVRRADTLVCALVTVLVAGAIVAAVMLLVVLGA